jgi:hypothetical protein
MAALSDYLESGVLNHLFRSTPLSKPSQIAIALTSDVAKDADDGSSIPEIPETANLGSTGYTRADLENPLNVGNSTWNDIGLDNLTAFAVFSEQVDHSGYFYPVYLTADAARSADNANGANPPNAEEYTFDQFGSTIFYAPKTMDASGVASNPGYTLYEGNGFIKNAAQIKFPTALSDWGWVSGIAILDHKDHGSGNLLMYAELNNPRYVYTGDSIKFDINGLEISLN